MLASQFIPNRIHITCRADFFNSVAHFRTLINETVEELASTTDRRQIALLTSRIDFFLYLITRSCEEYDRLVSNSDSE